MIQVYKTPAELSRAAVEIFVQAAQEAVQENGRFVVALTGGSSPEQLYKLLAQAPYRDLVPWAQTYVFWGDERWVPLTDDRSNAKMAFEMLLHHVPVPKSHIYPMWSTEQPQVFAQVYEKQLLNVFDGATPQFDLILLGMGDDGHTASLFPSTPVLHEKEKWVQAYYLEPQSMYRITLTAPCLNAARKIVFMTFGEKKAKALREVLEGEPNPELYPSQLIQPQSGETLWLVDEAAAQLLESKA
ncbi:6-phosphogluconolactonase [Rufibacter sediminis]|uniref:6-phosphogluconolactonase n=1 Tax=Rufibacter sediminis TaxID=2762756 RepID=A0ABR6VVY0_9BACT|nr:6-phosphogluconolactonase [Rufibacter sediminis]MBC3541057.1 6-phosphogluconolactonase [Rufibacter sediminis]